MLGWDTAEHGGGGGSFSEGVDEGIHTEVLMAEPGVTEDGIKTDGCLVENGTEG